MAFDEYLGERIKRILCELKVDFTNKKMMGGLLFLVDDKMLCGIHFDNKKKLDLLMARVGEEAYLSCILKKYVHPMDFTGRPMKGYVFVDPNGFDTDEDLEFWLQKCVDFNPLAKSSKKRKK